MANIENRPKVSRCVRDPDNDEWLQSHAGRERFKIRIASSQTMGAYAVIEFVADPHKTALPFHIHSRGGGAFHRAGRHARHRGWRQEMGRAPPGTSVTVKKGRASCLV